MLSAVSFLVAMPDASKAMRSSTCIMSFCIAVSHECSVRFLSAGSIHFILRSVSLAVHEFSSIGFWQPTYCTSYSWPFLPLRRETSLSTWPGFWPMSSSSSSVSSRKFLAWPSRSMPPEKRHSM